MGKIFISNVYLDGKQKDILINGERIEKISPASAASLSRMQREKVRIIRAEGMATIPGFANMHTHAAMTLMRGAQEDAKLKKWLHAIWKREANLNEELVYYGTKLACIEMIKSGTTLYNDQYFYPDTAVRAAQEMGLRSWHSYVFLDLGNRKKADAQRDECERMYELSRKWGPLASFEIGVHAPYSVTGENIRWAAEFARKRGLMIHTHVAETGQERLDSLRKFKCSPVDYLDDMGFFGPDVIAAHCVWIDEKGIETLGRNRVTTVHNINSNLKLASGYKFKFQELIDAGANVCIGTDGVASSNNLDVLEAMKTAALVQKAWRKDPSAITLNELMQCACANGYRTFGLDGGRVAEGALADISLIRIDNYAFTPNINFLANLIYSAHSDCVDTVICNGKILMRGRKIKGEEEVYEKVNVLFKSYV